MSLHSRAARRRAQIPADSSRRPRPAALNGWVYVRTLASSAPELLCVREEFWGREGYPWETGSGDLVTARATSGMRVRRHISQEPERTHRIHKIRPRDLSDRGFSEPVNTNSGDVPSHIPRSLNMCIWLLFQTAPALPTVGGAVQRLLAPRRSQSGELGDDTAPFLFSDILKRNGPRAPAFLSRALGTVVALV
ncbi:hypothetical protein SKAU_G00120330 [Synaphobranchus kaupii]|uniref:Uncharacterized protein n=1 Tax=Synaphobranchus kaupii TaxID=118154 RepID=A0A9Q1FNJ2_SYNKA|nr:hypothetical protein SKAU_G00120330 [Synaphobranchus kaupii]